MNKPITLFFYSDPGHGWLAVRSKLILDLKISHVISQYSYISTSGETVYLEEDCDMQKFHDAMKAANREYKIKPMYAQGESKIRQLHPYSPARLRKGSE